MRVIFNQFIGNGPYRSAQKETNLDFAPAKGMKYRDGVSDDGHEIIEVTIEHRPDEAPSLVVDLAGNESDSADALAAIYKSWGWEVANHTIGDFKNLSGLR